MIWVIGKRGGKRKVYIVRSETVSLDPKSVLRKEEKKSMSK